ncbi:MAG: type II secretion system protein [Burkholderiales bacterium]|nr:type II secretion system protein [Burkholderiales bacterium]
MNAKLRARGVSLVEMIVVIAVTGILAAVVATFIQRPVEGYVDAVRRAELTDIADTALRRMTRDVRTALPNSLRVTANGNVRYIEYLQTSGGGRYRAEVDSGGLGDPLDFTAADATFDVIGPMPALAAGNAIVVYNLSSDPATTSNAYVGDNRASYSSNTATTITLTAAKLFPFNSPGKRFQVVQTPVTYACDPLPGGTGELRRVSGYAIQAAQPNNINAAPLSTAPVNALLARNVRDCAFSYAEVSQRTGVLALRLQLESGGESVRLFQQVHVNNVP